MFADAPDMGHFLLVEGASVYGFEIFLHLRCVGGSRETDVHVWMGENKAVAVGCGHRVLSFRHVFGLEELAPAGGGVDHDAQTVLFRYVREDVLFGAGVHGVVPGV